MSSVIDLHTYLASKLSNPSRSQGDKKERTHDFLLLIERDAQPSKI